eukprot:c4832_g1_i1 orf=229-468(-)
MSFEYKKNGYMPAVNKLKMTIGDSTVSCFIPTILPRQAAYPLIVSSRCDHWTVLLHIIKQCLEMQERERLKTNQITTGF